MSEFAPSSDPLVGRWTALRPVDPIDADFLYRLAIDPVVGSTWRFAGGHISPEDFRRTMWDEVLVQFMILNVRTGAPVGVVAARSHDLRNQHVQIAAALTPKYLGRGWPIEGVVLFLRHLFATWPFRRAYFTSVDSIADRYGSFADRHLVREAVLEEHVYRDGAFHALVIHTATREDVERLTARMLGRLP